MVEPPLTDMEAHNMQIKSANSASSQRASFLDAFRGVACLMVCFYHADVNLKLFGLTIWGFTGVHLFFIISGYLIFQPFLKSLLTVKPLPSTVQYYQNRFVRIVPTYLTALLLYLALRVVTHTHIPTPANILGHIFLVFNYFSEKDFYSINPVLWTLAIEAQFYLILPLIVYFVCRARKMTGISPSRMVPALLAAFFACGLTARGLEFVHFLHGQPAHVSALKFRSIFSFLDMFSVGMTIAYVEKSGAFNMLIQRVPAYVPMIVGTLLVGAANAWCSVVSPGEWLNSNSLVYTLFFPPLICIGFGLILLTNILYPRTQKNIFNTRPLVSLGLISYSIYLYHVGVQFAVFGHLHLERFVTNWPLRNFLNGLVALPFVLLFSALMYFLVEKPSVQWLKRKKEAQRAQTDFVWSSAERLALEDTAKREAEGIPR